MGPDKDKEGASDAEFDSPINASQPPLEFAKSHAAVN